MPGILNKKIYGLIGFPVKHSLSSFMHNAAFKALGIDAQYQLFEVKPEELDYFLQRLDNEGICGLNVTIPHKEKVLDFVQLDSASQYLRKLRAINTIAKLDNVWMGFNTDIPGFERSLKENIDPAGKRVALLGAGGACRAVAFVLAKSQAGEISVFDIDKNKSLAVVKMIKELFPGCKINFVEAIEKLDTRNKDLLINATPVGLKEADPLPIKEEFLHKDLFVYDLIYNPAETKLLAAAKEIGAKTSNGLRMLLYQGMLSFEIWTSKSAPREAMEWALLKAVGRV